MTLKTWGTIERRLEGPLKFSAEKYKHQQEELLNDTNLKQLLWKGEWQNTLFNYRCKIFSRREIIGTLKEPEGEM